MRWPRSASFARSKGRTACGSPGGGPTARACTRKSLRCLKSSRCAFVIFTSSVKTKKATTTTTRPTWPNTFGAASLTQPNRFRKGPGTEAAVRMALVTRSRGATQIHAAAALATLGVDLETGGFSWSEKRLAAQNRGKLTFVRGAARLLKWSEMDR